MFNTQSRSQVGIGTLIVFIAMVLVAAIASGVLIQTAGLLQSQAQSTGQETTSEVSDLVKINNIVGYETSNFPSLGASVENNQITHLNVSVGLASGSDPVNLSEASYAIETSSNATFVNGNPTAQKGITFYREQSLKPDATILSEQDDVMIVQFNLTKIEGIDPLKENGKLKLILNSPAGSQSTKAVDAPNKIEKGRSYIL